VKSFKEKVIDVVSSIPMGEHLSYEDVAVLVGSPRSYRAVGNILNKNYDMRIPCHRVIRSDGSYGGYNRGKRQKEKILEHETVLATQQKLSTSNYQLLTTN